MYLQPIVKSYRNRLGAIKLHDQDGCRLKLSGIQGTAAAVAMVAWIQQFKGTLLTIAPTREEAAYLYNDINTLLPGSNTFFFPEPARGDRQSTGNNQDDLLRTEILHHIATSNSKRIIVTYPSALLTTVAPASLIRKRSIRLKKGTEATPESLCERLRSDGFEEFDFVTTPGTFARRGGLVDAFSLHSEFPCRIDFDGNTVDEITLFNAATQRSFETVDEISIVAPITKDEFGKSEQLLPELIPNAVVWHAELMSLVSALQEAVNKDADIRPDRPEALLDALQAMPLVISTPARGDKTGPQLVFDQAPQPRFAGHFEKFVDHLLGNKKAGYKNVIACTSRAQINRIRQIVADKGHEDLLTILEADLHAGFIDHDCKTAVYTDHQLFDRYHRYRLKEGFNRDQGALALKNLGKLKKGDFITHIDHGVGCFDGLEQIDANGKTQEAVRIRYKDGDLLYVSIHSLHRIARYTGSEGSIPSVHKLGSAAWQNLKQRTKKRIKTLAYDLIRLYAQRKAAKGFAFSPDNYLQYELEASFIYQDTPDQENATTAIKKDMESDCPMDRLVCGDVGFGKTELAIRAAFKAVCDSKQVAILVPTTVLAMQHYKTFSERLKDFPSQVEYLNRFKSAGEQRRVVNMLKAGQCDIVIGTHRLLSKDIRFKDLGLLIVDEEQKFGVAAKDKLKSMRTNVDILTLTATPIPRTLQYSMMGARDMSILNTPPPDRYPVQTELLSMQIEKIIEIIRFEQNRGGQVFFVHNRISNIAEVAEMIRAHLPGIKLAVAHGQMEGKKLEQAMIAFIEGRCDVLLSTAIIENGLDIPNANTIIINNAHHFGLSDLHQMRGRVGRSDKRAFCYLVAPPMESLTPESRERLRAMIRFSDLGSGFQIAMRDLDIRGAGNILGGEQSGFINDMGFDTYRKILDEAVEELKKESFAETFREEIQADCQIETDLPLLLDTDYVNNIQERIALYRRLSEAENEQELEAFRNMLEDRFGPLPENARDLIESIRLKQVAGKIGFAKLVLKNGGLKATFASGEDEAYYQSDVFGRILSAVQQHPGQMKLEQKGKKLTLSCKQVENVETALCLILPFTKDAKTVAG